MSLSQENIKFLGISEEKEVAFKLQSRARDSKSVSVQRHLKNNRISQIY